MTAHDILSKWLEYTKYDENQTKFNMLSSNYYFHCTTEKMKKVMQFDPSGTLAVLFAKQAFLKLCKESSISYFDLFTKPEEVAEDREMWDILISSEETKKVEEELLSSIDTLVQQVVPTKMLGDRDKGKEREVLLDSIATVVEELESCHDDLFLKGSGPIQKITHFSTHIHVFDKLSTCLLAMESHTVQDGLYLCFIKNGDTADCYFSFMLKSNGNLLSINERVGEAYPGQHKNSRNGRWSEKKKYNLFPYKYIIEADDFDYKGYSHKQVIDEEKLAFFNLSADAYMPLILGMVCIVTKYTGMSTESMKLKLVDSLLPHNLALPSPAVEALTVPVDSEIVAIHAGYVSELTSEQVLSSELSERYQSKNYSREELVAGVPTGYFGEEDNLFVKLYGAGFELRTNELLITDPHLRLPDGKKNPDDSLPNNEFIGTAEYLNMIAYQQARQQLASYLRERIFEEYLAFGGKEATEKWFADAIHSHKDALIDLCVQKYISVKQGDETNIYSRDWNSTNGALRFLAFGEKQAYKESGFYGTKHPFNKTKLDKYGREMYGKYLCMNTGSECSIEFVFRPWDWEEMQQLFGELPKPLMGWKLYGHQEGGNSILDVTDAVSGVGTVYERDEQIKNKMFTTCGWDSDGGSADKDGKYPRPQTEFKFAIAFSKRGWAQELKKRGVDPAIIKAPMPTK